MITLHFHSMFWCHFQELKRSGLFFYLPYKPDFLFCFMKPGDRSIKPRSAIKPAVFCIFEMAIAHAHREVWPSLICIYTEQSLIYLIWLRNIDKRYDCQTQYELLLVGNCSKFRLSKLMTETKRESWYLFYERLMSKSFIDASPG